MTDSRSSDTTRSGSGATARQRAIDAYDSARGSVADAGRRAADTLTEAPLIALAGGLAAGALIAALLPRTDAEDRWVRPTARRVRRSANAAFDAARTTGTQRLGEVGLSREKGEETIRSLLDRVTDVAKATAQAATDAAKNAN
ncbi:hypothetical protein [Sphingomonas sp.]|uniref:hypothetical protein n=1 Tax=Sphingomonas sp. TaxID=28214 RepID=UPI0025FFEED0|nr:hypothetical protein [Sphingomonas sp.]MBV9528519.1 hypothetical protein [Sphingomonas sp.]